jgi:hypothetical protein
MRWLDEMQRLIRPGGHLVLTSHGRHTVRHDEWLGVYPRQASGDEWALEASGYWYEASRQSACRRRL